MFHFFGGSFWWIWRTSAKARHVAAVRHRLSANLVLGLGYCCRMDVLVLNFAGHDG